MNRDAIQPDFKFAKQPYFEHLILQPSCVLAAEWVMA